MAYRNIMTSFTLHLFVALIFGVATGISVLHAACNVRCQEYSVFTAKTGAGDTTGKDYEIENNAKCVRMYNTTTSIAPNTGHVTITLQRDELIAGTATYSCYFQGGAYGEVSYQNQVGAGNPENFTCYTYCVGSP